MRDLRLLHFRWWSPQACSKRALVPGVAADPCFTAADRTARQAGKPSPREKPHRFPRRDPAMAYKLEYIWLDGYTP